jgi:predicted  nucleic acid-binding Zn-ribbon protein
MSVFSNITSSNLIVPTTSGVHNHVNISFSPATLISPAASPAAVHTPAAATLISPAASPAAVHTSNASALSNPLQRYTYGVSTMWRKTLCTAMKFNADAGPLVQEIASILREAKCKKEEWDKEFIKNAWLSSDFIRLVRSVKTFKGLVFTADNQLDSTNKTTKKMKTHYQKLHEKSEQFLSELRDAFEKEEDIANVMKPVETIPQCRDLSEKILTNQRNITSRVYKLLFPEEEEIGSATDAVAEDEGEEGSEQEAEQEGEETMENLRAQLEESRQEVTSLRHDVEEMRTEVLQLRRETYELKKSNRDLGDENQELKRRIEIHEPSHVIVSQGKRTRFTNQKYR